MINKIIQIIKGYTFFLISYNQKEYDRKYGFCKNCVYKKKNILGMEYCGKCKCVLQAKLRVNSPCPIKKF